MRLGYSGLAKKLGGLFFAMSAATGCAQTTRPAAVYDHTFAEDAKHWKPFQTTQTPEGEHVFLGQFVDETPAFTIDDLPKHDYLRVSFDLYILMTWDGNGQFGYGVGPTTPVGPDWFTVSDDQNDVFLADTFSNVPTGDLGFKRLTARQTYPSPVPGEQVPAQTGSRTHNSLGYFYHAGPGFQLDSVYPVTLLIPHHSNHLQLNFAARLIDPVKEPRLLYPEESWGLDHLKIEALNDADLSHPNAEESQRLLTVATGKDPAAAREAYEALLGGKAETRKVLRDAHDKAGVDWKSVQTWIQQLSADDSTTQAQARAHLIEQGAVVDEPVREATQVQQVVESNDNAQAVLDQIVAMPITDPAKRKAAVADRLLSLLGE